METLERAFESARSAYDAIDASCQPVDPERLGAACNDLADVLAGLQAALNEHLRTDDPAKLPEHWSGLLTELQRRNTRIAATLALWHRHTAASLEVLGLSEPALYGANGTRSARARNRQRALG